MAVYTELRRQVLVNVLLRWSVIPRNRNCEFMFAEAAAVHQVVIVIVIRAKIDIVFEYLRFSCCVVVD